MYEVLVYRLPGCELTCEPVAQSVRQIELSEEKAVRVKEGDMEVLPVSGSVESVVKPAERPVL